MHDWLTPSEVAELTGYHVVTIREALTSGRLTGVQERRRWYVRRDDALRWAGPRLERVALTAIPHA